VSTSLAWLVCECRPVGSRAVRCAQVLSRPSVLSTGGRNRDRLETAGRPHRRPTGRWPGRAQRKRRRNTWRVPAAGRAAANQERGWLRRLVGRRAPPNYGVHPKLARAQLADQLVRGGGGGFRWPDVATRRHEPTHCDQCEWAAAASNLNLIPFAALLMAINESGGHGLAGPADRPTRADWNR
jgi:hypothetical protein